MIEGDTELEQIVAAVAELLGEHEVVDVCIVLAQHLLGVGDQPIRDAPRRPRPRGVTPASKACGACAVAAPMRLHDRPAPCRARIRP